MDEVGEGLEVADVDVEDVVGVAGDRMRRPDLRLAGEEVGERALVALSVLAQVHAGDRPEPEAEPAAGRAPRGSP